MSLTYSITKNAVQVWGGNELISVMKLADLASGSQSLNQLLVSVKVGSAKKKGFARDVVTAFLVARDEAIDSGLIS